MRSRPTPGSSTRSRRAADRSRSRAWRRVGRGSYALTMTRVLQLIGTPKGAFILESDAARQDWTVRGPLCEGWPIHDLIVEPRTGDILAAGGSPWYGAAVWRSADLGETWTHSSAGLAYPRRRRGAAQDGVEPGHDARWCDPRRCGTGGPVPQRRRRRDVGPCRRPHEPPQSPYVGPRRWRPDPAHDRAAPHGSRPDLGRDLGGRGLRDPRWRGQLGAA